MLLETWEVTILDGKQTEMVDWCKRSAVVFRKAEPVRSCRIYRSDTGTPQQMRTIIVAVEYDDLAARAEYWKDPGDEMWALVEEAGKVFGFVWMWMGHHYYNEIT